MTTACRMHGGGSTTSNSTPKEGCQVGGSQAVQAITTPWELGILKPYAYPIGGIWAGNHHHSPICQSLRKII